jgi:hypothetical protein
MTRALGLVIAAMLAASPVGASPVTRTCAYKGRLQIGALTVTLDESARTVKTEYGGGRVYVYRDGARALNCAPLAGEATTDCGFADQFVTIRPDRVEVGFRWPEDKQIAHMAYVPRAAFQNPRAPCVWRALWDFGTV